MDVLTFLFSAVAAVSGALAIMMFQFPAITKAELFSSRGYPCLRLRIETNLPGARVLSLRVHGYDVSRVLDDSDPLKHWAFHPQDFVPELTNVAESRLNGFSETLVLVLRDKAGSYPSELHDGITIEMSVSWRWFKWRRHKRTMQ